MKAPSFTATRVDQVTPSDVTELGEGVQQIYVGTAGNVNIETVCGSTAIFVAQNGQSIPVRAKKVLSTSTTASDILALW